MSNQIVKCHACRRLVIGQKTIKPYSLADLVAIAFLGIVIGIIAVEMSRRSWLRCPHCRRVMRRPMSRVDICALWMVGVCGVAALAYLLVPELLFLSPTIEARVESISAHVHEQTVGFMAAGSAILLMLLATTCYLAIRLVRARRQLNRIWLENADAHVEEVPEEWTYPASSGSALRRGTNPFTDLPN